MMKVSDDILRQPVISLFCPGLLRGGEEMLPPASHFLFVALILHVLVCVHRAIPVNVPLKVSVAVGILSNPILFLDSLGKSSVGDVKKATTESKKTVVPEVKNKMATNTSSKAASSAVKPDDIKEQADGVVESNSASLLPKGASVQNTNDVSEAEVKQTAEEINAAGISKDGLVKDIREASSANSLNTPVKTNSENLKSKTSVVSSNQTAATPAVSSTASKCDTPENSKSGTVQTTTKTSHVQTVTLIGSTKPTTPGSTTVKSQANSVPNQTSVKIVGHNGLPTTKGNASSVTVGMNKSVGIKIQETKKERPLFKLGMEKTFEQYVNQFSTNILAKNKQQAQEERDRRRGISTKFNLAEYTYAGSIIGGLERILLTLRCSIVALESSIPTAFMHPMWPVQRSTWVKAVHICRTAAEFASVLTFFESFIKPVVMRSVCNDAVGHLEFFRNLTESKAGALKKPVKEEEDDVKKIELIGKGFCLVFFSYVFDQIIVRFSLFPYSE